MLRVWLPLTKDLRQQGLDDVTITTANTNVFQNEGKLGSKSLDVSGHYAFRVPSLVKKRVFSCAFWYKPITDSSLSDNWRRIIVFDTYTSDGSTTGAIFRFESSYGHQSSSTTYCISIHNNVGEPIASIDTSLGATDGWNKWQHITITADGTTLRCYRDGVQVASGAMSNGGMLQGTVHIGYSGNRPVGRLNDFRLYDHCLSQMEVKELSKGLVLHYPLNRNGWGQENLLLNSNDLTLWPIESSGKIELQEDGYFKVSSKASNTTRYGIYYDFTFPEPNTYTFSVDVRDDWLIGVAPASTFAWTTANLSGTQGKKRISYTCVSTEENNKCRIYIAGNGTGGRVTYLKQPKFEKGSIATPWCPNSSDTLATTMGLNGTTEYDCSGYGNNGTKTGTFTWSSDTPKYQISTIFSNNRIQCSGNFLEGLTTATLSAWIKLKSYHSERCMIIFANGRYLTVNSSGQVSGYSYGKSPAGYHNGTKIIPLNTWTHVTVVWDASNLYIYVNGILDKTIACTGIFTNSGGYISIGQEGNGGRSADGYISDARIYATALSADDVKSLYQNSAYIDSSGNVYGTIHES